MTRLVFVTAGLLFVASVQAPSPALAMNDGTGTLVPAPTRISPPAAKPRGGIGYLLGQGLGMAELYRLKKASRAREEHRQGIIGSITDLPNKLTDAVQKEAELMAEDYAQALCRGSFPTQGLGVYVNPASGSISLVDAQQSFMGADSQPIGGIEIALTNKNPLAETPDGFQLSGTPDLVKRANEELAQRTFSKDGERGWMEFWKLFEDDDNRSDCPPLMSCEESAKDPSTGKQKSAKDPSTGKQKSAKDPSKRPVRSYLRTDIPLCTNPSPHILMLNCWSSEPPPMKASVTQLNPWDRSARPGDNLYTNSTVVFQDAVKNCELGHICFVLDSNYSGIGHQLANEIKLHATGIMVGEALRHFNHDDGRWTWVTSGADGWSEESMRTLVAPGLDAGKLIWHLYEAPGTPYLGESILFEDKSKLDPRDWLKLR